MYSWKLDVRGISEVQWLGYDKITWEDYNLINSGGKEHKHGVGILPRKEISHKVPPQNSEKANVNVIADSNRQLVWYLETNTLNEAQYGCRKGRSTPMALAHFLDALINEACADNATHYPIFFDLENAFPRKWRHHILKSLHQYGLCGALPPLMQNYLLSSSFQVKVTDHLFSVDF